MCRQAAARHWLPSASRSIMPGTGKWTGSSTRSCPCRKPHLAGERPRIGRCCCVMRDLCRLIGWMVVDLFRSRVALEAEILTLRQQINVLRRTAPAKLSFGAIDRLVFVGLYRLFPKVCDALAIVKPDTVIRWHRAGFRLYWRWKSRRRGGRPTVPLEIRKLIREMSIANSLWGAPRIHGELLKLGIEIGQTSVAKYIPANGFTYSVDSEVYQDAAIDGVPEDLVAGLMETAERDFRRGLAQELVAAEKATDDDIGAEIDKFKP